jgi:hypothetical protein
MTSGEFVRHDVPSVPAESVGAVLLRDLIDPQSLPIRLREEFTNRPWPSHDLGRRLVDMAYVPPPLHQALPSWTLEIVADTQVRINGRTANVRDSNLELLNLMLLTRDWVLRAEDYCALGFAACGQSSDASLRRFKWARRRLQQKAAPNELFYNQKLTAERAYTRLYCLNPALRLADRRAFD